MPVWDDLHKLKDALDRNNVPEQEPAGGAKGQEEVRAEMHGETKKVEQIQKKEGWSDRVSFVSLLPFEFGSLTRLWVDQRCVGLG